MWKKIHKPRDWAKPQGQTVSVSASDKIHAISGFGHGGYALGSSATQPKIIVPEPLPSPSYAAAHARNPSSVYSRESTAPQSRGDGYPQRYSSAYHSGYGDRDVSPPVSPIREHYSSSKGSQNVSPIEEPIGSPITGKYGKESRLPRRTGYAPDIRTGNSDMRSSSGSKQLFTKLDEYAGEPLANDKGKYAQVTPGSLPLEDYSGVSSSQRSQFDLRHIDPRLGHMNVPKTRGRTDSDTSAYGNPPPPPSKDGGYRSQSSTQPSGNKARSNKELPEAPKPRPAVPQKDSTSTKATPAPLTIPTSTYSSLFEETPQPTPASVWGVGRFGVDSAKHSTTRDSTEESDVLSDTLTKKLQGVGLSQEPCSRFSVTTYAPTEPGSPPPTSDAFDHPLPAISSRMHQFSLKNTTRKPTPSQMTTVSEAETLPQTQPETNISARIDEVKAKLADLARRKVNIDTMIHELTQVIQPSSIAYDMATRSEVSKTVTSLNNELADIKKEEHELGLKLLRAYKKRDQGDIYASEPTLWVKRVTS
ncbi:uncharacterized protein GIQ15_01059 [Arthroderma uncinatum]|uniref:uncharacterized protein n=1 Tax=Arthroderma uncinatum TaxID=74035 RepID=UPI00144A8840|nr:uncharacterized protein GIQ15_01059 [Arthroderma uncinatum]KAF3491542.1 hypothetical protein GIQ15_01059 [Arthroderma uncinatum]